VLKFFNQQEKKMPSGKLLVNLTLLGLTACSAPYFQNNNNIPKLEASEVSLKPNFQKTPHKSRTGKTVPMPDEIRAIIKPNPNDSVYTILLTKRYFPNEPIMHFVASCESGRIHREKGKLLPNRLGSSSKGAFQVLMSKHKETMNKMGLSPNKDKDYFKYVKYLFEKRGTKDWYMSEHCWGKYQA